MERNDAELERVTIAKVTWRLLPLMALLYVISILDRVNVGVAVLTMKPDLGFTDGIYGLGAGIFYIGYVMFEVPSNVLMDRFGARRWIARILFTWGVLASCMMFVKTPMSFYVMRFLLGAAEAGFFPGMMLYLTYWFPNSVRGRTVARFVIANVGAMVIGGPLGASLLKMEGIAGLHGWQWLYLVEGLPAVLMGFVVLAYMTDRPEQAHWLSDEQRNWLIQKLASEREHRQKHHHMSLMQAFRYPRVVHLGTILFLNIMAGAGLQLFSNLLLKQRSDWVDSQVLWLSALPNILGAITTLISGNFSDRSADRRLYVAAGLGVASLGVVVTATASTGIMTLVGLSIVAIGTAITNPPFWALTTGFLTGAAAAGGIAFINSLGNTGSFFGPVMMGYLKDMLKSYEPALFILAGVFAMGAFVAFRLPPDPAQQAEAAKG